MIGTSIAVILRIFSNPIANLFEKKASIESSSLYTNFYSYLIMAIATIPFLSKYDWTSLSAECWGYALLAGLLCATARACMVKALQQGELSVLGPINSFKSVVGLVVAFFMLSEIPTIFGIIGMCLIIFGSRYIFDTLEEGFSLKLFKRQDINLRFAALILTGIEAVILKKIILLSSFTISFILWAWTGCIYTFLMILFIKRKYVPVKKDIIYQYFIIAIALAVMQLSTNYVFLNMNVGYALALFQLSSVVNLLFGIKFFTETNLIKKLIGTLIMIIGSVIIILN